MKMTVKEPGLGMELAQSELELLYTQKYESTPIPEAYERLILDCINGDQQHFVRRDELVAAWKIFTPLLKYIDAGGMNPELYPYRSRGPVNADKLRQKTGHVLNLTAKDITWAVDVEVTELWNRCGTKPAWAERRQRPKPRHSPQRGWRRERDGFRGVGVRCGTRRIRPPPFPQRGAGTSQSEAVSAQVQKQDGVGGGGRVQQGEEGTR